MPKKEEPKANIKNAPKGRFIANPCGYMAATTTLKVIGSKWKVLILWKLISEGPQRYYELRKAICTISEKMLSQVLREMVQDQLILRKEEVTKAPKVVVYTISGFGLQTKPIIESMIDFGKQIHVDNMGV